MPEMLHEEEPTISASLFGQSVAAKGTSAIIILVLVLALGAISFLLWDRGKQSDAHLDALSQSHAIARDRQTVQSQQEHQMLVEGLKAVQQVNEKISELIDEQNYIVLSSEADRKEMKTKLRRPPSLSRKLDR